MIHKLKWTQLDSWMETLSLWDLITFQINGRGESEWTGGLLRVESVSTAGPKDKDPSEKLKNSVLNSEEPETKFNSSTVASSVRRSCFFSNGKICAEPCRLVDFYDLNSSFSHTEGSVECLHYIFMMFIDKVMLLVCKIYELRTKEQERKMK